VTASPSTIFWRSRNITSALPSFIRDSPSITHASFWDAPTWVIGGVGKGVAA
jgi:hypothetical protein